MERRKLVAKLATPEGLAPFGQILGNTGATEMHAPEFYEGKVRVCMITTKRTKHLLYFKERLNTGSVILSNINGY